MYGQHGKRKRALILGQLGRSEESYSANLGVGNQEDLEVCGKYGGTHGFACHKFRCFKCGEGGMCIEIVRRIRYVFIATSLVISSLAVLFWWW